MDHLLDFVLVAGECQVRGNTEIFEFIEISEGSFPSAVFHVTGLQVDLLVSGVLRELSEEGLIVGI